MSFKVFTHTLRNALIKRKRYVILPNYSNYLLICFSLKKKVIIALETESGIYFETIFFWLKRHLF